MTWWERSRLFGQIGPRVQAIRGDFDGGLSGADSPRLLLASES